MLLVPGLIDDVRGHGHRGVGERPKRLQIPLQFLRRSADTGQGLVTVGTGPTVPGYMLYHPNHTHPGEALQ